MDARNELKATEYVASLANAKPSDNQPRDFDWDMLRMLLSNIRSATSKTCAQTCIRKAFPDFSASQSVRSSTEPQTTKVAPPNDREYAFLIVLDQYESTWSNASDQHTSQTNEASTSLESAVHPDLTRRESQVFDLVAEAHTNAMIARGLGISIRTVEKHVENILRKLRLSDRRELILATHKKK